ncbi:GNAT family N-acetyltransferase [Domibacillus tundrae]|uniref:GNAT family N-acetyltransferase n=1 Tax=Domibacillus tundrae TaxID=1587527 RepID=UPI003398E3EF
MSQQQLPIIPVRERDVPIISKWTEEWLGAAHPLAYSLTIFSSPGYTKFLEYQQSVPLPRNPMRLLGAYDGDEMLGFIELRRMPDRLFINNFCVKPEARGRRIGELLLRHTEQMAESMNLSTVGLDCFLWNERALEKYVRSGFQKTNRMHWFTGSNDRSAAEAPIQFVIEEQEKADAHQKKFGFSQFHIQTKNGQSQVNRLKDSYFRVTAEERDPEYYNILSQLDRRRSLFMIRADEVEMGDGWKQASTSVRLEKQIN